MKYDKKLPSDTIVHTIDITGPEFIPLVIDAVRRENPNISIPMLPTTQVQFRPDIAGNMTATLRWTTRTRDEGAN